MKPLHVGLLVVGAAIAGGLAMKMTEPAALPVLPARPAADSAKAVPVNQVAVKPISATMPVSDRPGPPPVPYTRDGAPSDASTAAPPAIYSEPAHTSSKRTPFPAPAPPPQQIAKVNSVPAPLPYQEPMPMPLPIAPEPEQQPNAAEQPSSAASTAPLLAPMGAPARRVTLEPGLTVSVRLLETLSSDRVSVGDAFSGSLAEPLIIDGLVIAERGARVDGRVIEVRRPTRMNGNSELQLALSTITTSDGQRVNISTEPWSKQGADSRRSEAEEIGGGAALGAIIGAIAGGGKGAAIGAGIGGGAGVSAAVATKSRPVTVATESVIRFRLNARITITERRL